MGKILGKGDFFAKSSPFPMPLSPQKLGGGEWCVKITIKSLRPRREGGAKRRIGGRNSRVSAILCSRNSYKCAICCCRDNRKSVTSYNGNKHRTVIRRSKNKLQIVILCIEIFNTYTKFADKISVFSLFFPPPLYSTLLEKGCGEKHFS